MAKSKTTQEKQTWLHNADFEGNTWDGITDLRGNSLVWATVLYGLQFERTVVLEKTKF